VNIKNLSATAEIRATSPSPRVRRSPPTGASSRNLAAQVNLGDTSLSVGGRARQRAGQVKPVIDKTVADQITALAGAVPKRFHLRAQRAAAMDKTLPLDSAADRKHHGSLPSLWLEMKPTGALAAQPRVDASAVLLTVGIEAETRITPAQTKPDCPFPTAIALVAPAGTFIIAVPIDVPFTEINKIVQAQFAGRVFPEDGSGSVDVTVKRASVAPWETGC